MSCDIVKATEGFENEFDVGEVMERLENEQSSFTYVITHSPTLPSLYLRHSPLLNPSVASPTSQFILQPFFRFSYVTSFSHNSPGEPPMLPLLHLRHSSFSNPSFASPTSQALHLRHLASRPCITK